jgi:hypothetical protein
MASIAEIRAALAAQQSKGKGNGQKRSSGGGDNASYPFWNIDVGASATLRLIPDLDPTNTLFWRNREVIKLPFEGVVGGEYPTNERVEVTVPCVAMFGMACPITAATKHLWNDESTKALARVYWKKKSYIYNGFVVNSPFVEETVPENPIRRFVINPTIHKIIESSLANPDMEDNPTDYVGGRDFRISKSQSGQWADYGTSNWSMKVRSLNETEMAAIEQYKPHDLKAALGRVPDADELSAIKAMFDASFAGEPFDAASFGQYYRAYGARGSFGGGGSNDTGGEISQVTKAAPAAPVAPVTESAAPAAGASASNSADVLAKIRARIKQ